MSFVAFRLDSSRNIGSGHIQRCVTLANHLKEHGINSVFICKNHPQNFNFIAEKSGYKIYSLPERLTETEDAVETLKILNNLQIKTLVVDHYGLGINFEQPFLSSGIKTVVIDDLMNRPHICHALLDQNYKTDYGQAYKGLVPANCQLFLGPQYALLRPAFYAHKKPQTSLRQNKNIFVFFGGADATGDTYRFIQDAVLTAPEDMKFSVLVSQNNSQIENIKSLKKDPRLELLIEPGESEIAKAMQASDLYFGSGGTITWERMSIGITGYVVSVADNQIAGAQALHDDHFHIYLGHSSELDFKNTPGLLQNFHLNLNKNWEQNCPSKERLNYFIKTIFSEASE